MTTDQLKAVGLTKDATADEIAERLSKLSATTETLAKITKGIGLPEDATEDEIAARLSSLSVTAEALKNVTPGQTTLPPEINRDAFEKRRKVLLEHGTPPDVAAQFALSAEVQQLATDRRLGIAR